MADDTTERVIEAWGDAGLLTDEDPKLAYPRLVRAWRLADIAVALLHHPDHGPSGPETEVSP